MRNEVEEMLDQCLEFGDITNMFDCIKDDLQNLGDNAEVTINTSIDAETGLDRCKVTDIVKKLWLADPVS